VLLLLGLRRRGSAVAERDATIFRSYLPLVSPA
jgi:hypothetical protein